MVLLNLNVLMAPPSIGKPVKALSGLVSGEAEFSASEEYGLVLTFALGGVNFLGYFVVMYYVALTEVPILIQKFDLQVAADRELVLFEDYTDPGAFTFWFVTLVFNVMFCVMHFVHFGPMWSLYMATVLGVNLPWTLSCVRNYIVVADSRAQRAFCITYDTLVTKPFFRNHLLLQFLSLQGFFNSEYFTLMLLDVINNSPILVDIIQSVKAPGMSLAMVLYLFTCTIVIWASFGVAHFADQFPVAVRLLLLFSL